MCAIGAYECIGDKRKAWRMVLMHTTSAIGYLVDVRGDLHCKGKYELVFLNANLPQSGYTNIIHNNVFLFTRQTY